MHKACPIRINKLLADNGKEFTDRLFASREREPSRNHEFDRLCQALTIEHRLTKPRTPRTNAMLERFNVQIADVLKTHRLRGGEDLEQTLLRYVARTPTNYRRYHGHSHMLYKKPYDRLRCVNKLPCEWRQSPRRVRSGCEIAIVDQQSATALCGDNAAVGGADGFRAAVQYLPLLSCQKWPW